jgi:hypothetical protein
LNSYKKPFLFFFIFSVICNIAFSQVDSTLQKFWGLNTGSIHYSSIDEIFTPFNYSGYSANFEIYKRVVSNKDIREYTVSFASIKRAPENVKLYSKFIETSYDGGTYSINADKQFKSFNTLLFSSSFKYLRKLAFPYFKKHTVYYGISADFFAGIRNSIADPELFSFAFSPGIAYKYNLNNHFSLLIESSVSVLSVNLRKPYSGAEAQLTDTYTAKYYYDYALSNYAINFVNSYFKLSNSVMLQSRISDRTAFTISYISQYMNLKFPRNLTSATDIVEAGINIKFK